jgi:hypothetical protein
MKIREILLLNEQGSGIHTGSIDANLVQNLLGQIRPSCRNAESPERAELFGAPGVADHVDGSGTEPAPCVGREPVATPPRWVRDRIAGQVARLPRRPVMSR